MGINFLGTGSIMQEMLGAPGCTRVWGPKSDIGTTEPGADGNWVLMGLPRAEIWKWGWEYALEEVEIWESSTCLRGLWQVPHRGGHGGQSDSSKVSQLRE